MVDGMLAEFRFFTNLSLTRRSTLMFTNLFWVLSEQTMKKQACDSWSLQHFLSDQTKKQSSELHLLFCFCCQTFQPQPLGSHTADLLLTTTDCLQKHNPRFYFPLFYRCALWIHVIVCIFYLSKAAIIPTYLQPRSIVFCSPSLISAKKLWRSLTLHYPRRQVSI